MRFLSLLGILGLVATAACSSENGALLVVTNPDNAPVVRLEVVLASSGEANAADVMTVKQRISPQSTLDEDVRYYKQESTSQAIATGSGKMGAQLSVLLAPTKDMAATYIPFVFGYDANDQLVAIGRVSMGDADATPAAIAIPKSKLERFDVALEAMAPPDPTAGIARGTGATVACQTDNVVRGAAWKFAKGIQLRIVFASPNATSGLDNPYDLDCDGHAVDPAQPTADCDDLQGMFNAGAAEVCGDPDFNCDGALAGRTVCQPYVDVPLNECPGHTGCLGDPNGGPSTCTPDPLAANTDACFCARNACSDSGKCVVDYAGLMGQEALCAPAYAMVPPPCAQGSACTVEIKSTPQDWNVEIALITSGGTAAVTWGSMVVVPMTGGYIGIRTTPANAGVTFATPGLPDSFEVEVRTGSSGNGATRHTIGLDLQMQSAGVVCPLVVLAGVADHVDPMSCSITW